MLSFQEDKNPKWIWYFRSFSVIRIRKTMCFDYEQQLYSLPIKDILILTS